MAALSADDLLSRGDGGCCGTAACRVALCSPEHRDEADSSGLEEQGSEEFMGTAQEHGGKPARSPPRHPAPRCAARVPPSTPARAAGCSYLFQLAVDVLDDQVDGHRVSTP